MSRSNPDEGGSNNPAKRWFEWNGEHGVVRYYDRDTKKNIDVGSEFTFILLDQLGSVRGWHDASNSGIYSNEVKDTRQETLVVKAFKGGTIAEGIYKDIKDRVNSAGGQFTANLYIAFKPHDASPASAPLAIGSLRLKGAALGAWMEFTKANRADLYKKAIKVHGFTEGKKGRIVFRVPVLTVGEITVDTDRAALALDKELQQFFDAYFKRTKRDQAEEPQGDDAADYQDDDTDDSNNWNTPVTQLTDDDIPF